MSFRKATKVFVFYADGSHYTTRRVVGCVVNTLEGIITITTKDTVDGLDSRKQVDIPIKKVDCLKIEEKNGKDYLYMFENGSLTEVTRFYNKQESCGIHLH